MNAQIVLADLETARDRIDRALGLAAVPGPAPLEDCDKIAQDLRDARHLLDRAVNEIRAG